MPLYFAYGSNLDIQQMQQRCAEAVPIVAPGCLQGYTLAFNKYASSWGGGVADVVVAAGREVWGLVYDVSLDGLQRLDVYEGYPHMYTRFQGTISTAAGPMAPVWIYTVVNKQAFIPPSVEYLRIIQRAGKHFGFPAAYCTFLEQIPTCS
jgi:gamma-glutamylcyclotransferase (GGCT)/AIG2-like uncharacterized protein YtfP